MEDWQKLITEILGSGWTQKQVGDRLGVDQSTISLIHTGKTKSPEYRICKGIESLHTEVCPKRRKVAA